MIDASSALPNDELCETIDLLSTVMASVSDRVDAQTVVLDRLNKTATEARQAAFAAKAQTSPENYAEILGKTFDDHLAGRIKQFADLLILLQRQTNRTTAVLKQAEDDKLVLFRNLRTRERKIEHFKNCLPWFGLGAVVLALAMTMLLPRLFASNTATCTILGASWTTTTTGVDACVFYMD